MRTIVGFFNHKIYLLFVLLFAICLVNISCKENNNDKSNPKGYKGMELNDEVKFYYYTIICKITRMLCI